MNGRSPLRRSEPVLAVGGGVLTDTAGFACACWRRGIPWCRLPTTLLGIVDASVGIKVAINYHRKNGVGHFFSPIHTFIDTAFLGTVPLADIRSGCGEIMKAALIHDARLYELMEAHGADLIKERFQTSLEAARIIKVRSMLASRVAERTACPPPLTSCLPAVPSSASCRSTRCSNALGPICGRRRSSDQWTLGTHSRALSRRTRASSCATYALRRSTTVARTPLHAVRST